MVAGRPTKYRESFIEECYAFFDKPMYSTYIKQVATARGVVEIEEREANRIPTIEGFAIYLKVAKQRLYDWEKIYPEFRYALDFGRQRTKEFVNYHALQGNYNANYARFFATNATDMVEKKEVAVQVQTISIEEQDKDF